MQMRVYLLKSFYIELIFEIRESTLSMQQRGRRVLQIFQKKFVAQETIDLNISWPSIFFRKYYMTPPINFSFLFKVFLQHYFRIVLTVIFKFIIFTTIFKKLYSNKFSKKSLTFFAILKFFYNNKIKTISRKFISSSSTVNQLY